MFDETALGFTRRLYLAPLTKCIPSNAKTSSINDEIFVDKNLQRMIKPLWKGTMLFPSHELPCSGSNGLTLSLIKNIISTRKPLDLV